MSNMTFPYKHVLVIGATSGIGRAMSDHFIAEGIKVTAVGRRQDRLEEFVSKHGSENASGVPFDISELDKIPGFAQEYEEHQTVHFECFQLTISAS